MNRNTIAEMVATTDIRLVDHPQIRALITVYLISSPQEVLSVAVMQKANGEVDLVFDRDLPLPATQVERMNREVSEAWSAYRANRGRNAAFAV